MICSSFPKAFNKGAMNAHPDSATFAKANVQEIPIKDRVIFALDVPTVDEAEKMGSGTRGNKRAGIFKNARRLNSS